jgi:membrane-bound serine protease (ClpP class)
MTPLLWSSLLLAFGLLLVLLEVFVPSGGVMGFLAVTSVVTSIVLAFVHSGAEAGLVFVAIAAVGVPGVLALAFHWWPKTPLGKRLLLDLPTSDAVLPQSELKQALLRLEGKVGVTRSVMLPSGAVQVEGGTYDALSEGVPIEAGQRVRVIAVRGHHLLVRPLDPDDPEPHSAAGDPLSQPIEELGLRPIDDPLA